MMAILALLLGLFAVPGILLWFGHHLRRHGPRGKAAFWGGVVGWCTAVVCTLVAAVAPPVLWAEGVRELAVHWTLLGGGAAGLGAGALRGSS